MTAPTTPGLLDELVADLDAEGDRLRAVVADLPEGDDGWGHDTPAEGWSVAAQVAHLAWTDEAAALAARAHVDKASWDALVLAAMADPEGFVDTAALELAALPAADLLKRWDAGRAALRDALRAVPEGVKMPWFGPPMSPASMVTARFMETWAHARDVYDALGADPGDDDRVRHVCHLGIRTRGFAFANRGLEVPEPAPYVELTAPSGATWTWGDETSPERVTGPAVDFALLVTQRVHRADTALEAVGAGAEQWLDVAQAFAGPAGSGREPRAGSDLGEVDA
ncbi:MAG: TIGR03084 family protein [Nocardioides sp.]|nr:TIGR03084 family protein [Nocardioides sp.]